MGNRAQTLAENRAAFVGKGEDVKMIYDKLYKFAL